MGERCAAVAFHADPFLPVWFAVRRPMLLGFYPVGTSPGTAWAPPHEQIQVICQVPGACPIR
jgi:hypothetical protein